MIHPPKGSGTKPSAIHTFTNPGSVPADVAHDDVLTDVIDDADLDEDSIDAQAPLSAVLNAAGDRILITGTLPANSSRTVTYTVAVKDPLDLAGGDGSIKNFIVPTGEPPEECEPDDPTCTENPVVVDLSWNKVDATDERLAGSEWTFTPLDGEGDPIMTDQIVVLDCVAATAADCTGPDKNPNPGEFLLPDLTPGVYELEETKAPAGYQLLAAAIEVTMNTNVTFDVENVQQEGPQIPLTGGIGTAGIFLGAGGAMLLALAGIGWQRRRQSRTAMV